ncbi:MAG: hypothetical protein CVV15_08585 [Gammaproteobacteria bacterium HGW-Gammaproteobacteria-5]|jgi:hypothetical protein|uniref:Lipoprotein n=1 Tax=Pseudomonas songnenensis TaxID=1176259 RepID=A0ABX9UR97_9PSED|nr:MAG: hypothetical protein CVV15_08585 [Gammaproteobacteria bacterium HGW-Gammaproteobacteria-5]RMH95708.1 hypothetical protein EA798_14855 [Pseudomonas songnenensis]
MALHAQLGIVLTPALVLNGLALICALCGSWLLVITHCRQIGASRRAVIAQAPASRSTAGDTATQRINQVFYRFGWAGLLLGLGLSAASRSL